MESPGSFSESPPDAEDVIYPCKGCGQILEEGKAFELSGARWHIDCFRCNTCDTLLDSDANLLLLGDGTLICNNCTYSCSGCSSKIEDLAILTGDQAFCANCFKCRNCKKKIENLQHARTVQGIFCMECHQALMARRKKRSAHSAAHRQKATGNSSLLDKSLPSLPPAAPKSSFSPESGTPPSGSQSETPTEVLPRLHSIDRLNGAARQGSRDQRSQSPRQGRSTSRDTLNILRISKSRQSSMSQRSDDDGSGDDYLIPVQFDPTPSTGSSPHILNQRTTHSETRDYFAASKTADKASRRRSGGVIPSPLSSPHIAYQERGRSNTEEAPKKRTDGTFSAIGSADASPVVGPGQTRSNTAEERFKLQEVPRSRRSGGSARSSKSGPLSPPTRPFPQSPNERLELGKSPEMVQIDSPFVREPESLNPSQTASPRSKPDFPLRADGSVDSMRSAKSPAISQLPYPPKRGDSLESSKVGQSVPRKEVSRLQESPQISTRASPSASISTAVGSDHGGALEKAKSGKIGSRLTGSERSRELSTPSLSRMEDVSSSVSLGLSRIPSSPPSRHESYSAADMDTLRSGTRPISPGFPRWSAKGDLSMDEDMIRIWGEEEGQGQESFLRRVSNSVRHGRSFSDKVTRSSKDLKWPRSPINPGSSVTASPDQREDVGWFRNELRRERQRAVEREERITDLEATLHSTANIKQVNTELREKRSTIVVLDTKKEMAVRELDVLADHIATAKKTGEPLDLSKISHLVMRDFAESLQKLKDSFAPQIEDLVQKRNELLDELANLTLARDKSFQEVEQLSVKKAQLTDLNNQLVHQVQELYKSNSVQPGDASRGSPNGLGIYPHHRSQVSIDSREIRSNLHEISTIGSGTTLHQDEVDPVTVVQAPQVVNIRKGPPKKFNWKKGQNVAKGVTKGIKGAFASTQASYHREMQFTETVPYGSTPPPCPGDAISNMQRQATSENSRPAFGLFGGNQRPLPKGHHPWRSQSNGSSPALTIDPSTTLFGSDLEARAEFERTPIPFVVTRCIEEVELRGMDMEGIYRKAGASSQIQALKEGFETSQSPQDFDISDPDLDIHSVSSLLKQYLRRLPNPLITFEIYDKLLDTTSLSTVEEKTEAFSQAIMELPKVNRDVLEFLMFHLGRVISRERENLMTGTNVAVVFSPTIMRPESLVREMADTSAKNDVVKFLVDHCEAIFAGLPR